MQELANKYYIDITISKNGFEKDSGNLKKLAFLIGKVHYLNVNNNNLILSFPNYQKGEDKTLGNIVRIFTSSKKTLEGVLFMFQNDSVLKYLNISNIREYIINKDTVFYEYKKFNIPRKNNNKPSLKKNYREEKLLQAEDYPFIIIKSNSTKQSFSLFIEKRESNFESGKPNNYGLSNIENKVSVPEN